MASNLNKLVRIASILDKSGNFKLSDKIESLIKTSQFIPPTPADLPTTGTPDIPNKLLKGLLSDLEDSAAGSEIFGKGQMFSRFSPYRSKFGPDAPAILTTFTPAQFAKLLQTEEGRKYIAQQQLQSGLQTSNYIAQAGGSLLSLARFISQQLAPGVDKSRINEFLKILSTTMVEQLSRALLAYPEIQWNQRLKEFEKVANQYGYKTQITNLIVAAMKEARDKKGLGKKSTKDDDDNKVA